MDNNIEIVCLIRKLVNGDLANKMGLQGGKELL
jgi:hypothetical protein